MIFSKITIAILIILLITAILLTIRDNRRERISNDIYEDECRRRKDLDDSTAF